MAYTEKVKNINLKMPPIPIKQAVNGIVVREDGTPIKDAVTYYIKDAVTYYKIKSVGDHSRRYAYSKANGTFSFETFEEFETQKIAYVLQTFT